MFAPLFSLVSIAFDSKAFNRLKFVCQTIFSQFTRNVFEIFSFMQLLLIEQNTFQDANLISRLQL